MPCSSLAYRLSFHNEPPPNSPLHALPPTAFSCSTLTAAWNVLQHIPNATGLCPGPTLHSSSTTRPLQGYLAHKKTPTPLGPPQDLRHRATVRSYGGGVSYERGTPVRSAPDCTPTGTHPRNPTHLHPGPPPPTTLGAPGTPITMPSLPHSVGGLPP